jgi:hypothetical protein
MSNTELSLPAALHEKTLNRLVSTFNLEEVHGEDGGPYLRFISHAPMAQGEIGYMRVFKGGPFFQVVTATIVVPAIQLDSHMVFAFMPSDSPIPHFTVDSVCAGPHFAYHLDMIPRADLGSQLAYLNEVYQPLTEACQIARTTEGLSPAVLAPRQWAIMSPWMLASRANPEAFQAINKTVDIYFDHWEKMVKNGLSAAATEGLTKADLIARDKRNKEMIFNIEIDPVWQQITPLLGAEMVQKQIEVLRRTSA